MKRAPGVLTLPSSRGVVTKIGILWIAECRDISLEVVLNIVNERRGVNDEGAYLHVCYRTHEEFATLAAAILAIPVLRPALHPANPILIDVDPVADHTGVECA